MYISIWNSSVTVCWKFNVFYNFHVDTYFILPVFYTSFTGKLWIICCILLSIFIHISWWFNYDVTVYRYITVYDLTKSTTKLILNTNWKSVVALRQEPQKLTGYLDTIGLLYNHPKNIIQMRKKINSSKGYLRRHYLLPRSCQLPIHYSYL